MPRISFYLNNYGTKTKLKVGEVTIMASFSIGRAGRFGITTDEKIEPKLWDFKRQCAKPSHRHHIDINNALSDYKRDLLNLWKQNRAMLTFDEFKLLAVRTANPSQKKTLYEAYDNFLKSCESERDKKTVFKYLQLLDLLKAYNQIKPFDLVSMDLNFYDGFKIFLYSQPNKQYQKYQLVKDQDYYTIQPGKGNPVPLLDNTVYKILSNLKFFLGWCVDRGYTVPSYQKWSILRQAAKPISLTLSELEKLENAILPKHLAIARDYLVFECRTGQRISDIKRFDISNFHDNTWSFFRKKGNRIHSKQVHVHFEGYCAPALKILERYNFKLPEISEQKLNKHIKEACKIAGINSTITEIRYSGSKCIKFIGFKYEFISSHTGRKTFITLGLQFMSPKIVKDLAGISDYQTLKHYEGQSESVIIKQQLKDMDHKIKSA